MTTHHTLLSLPLPLSLTYFKHLQHISLSLSLYVYIYILQAMTTHYTPPLALFNKIRALAAHLSLSALHAPANHHNPPPAPSHSLSLSLIYRCRGTADSGHAASACDVHHQTQQTRH